jgi:hypothetical protein
MFWSMARRHWTATDAAHVRDLKGSGLADRQISATTGIPIETIRTWRQRGDPRQPDPRRTSCPRCGAKPHALETPSAAQYAYLLGVYLGDGHVRRWGNSYVLRVSLDTAYPGIVDEVGSAIATLRRGTHSRRYSLSKQLVNVESSWVAWPCLLPQHGPGRKHNQPIVLEDRQQRIVDAEPGQFLRGLIHTDGWRGTNKVTVKGRDYEYPRYQFSNRSDDIRGLFTDACDRLGVEWRPWTRHHVSVAKRASVEILDRYVGQKT